MNEQLSAGQLAQEARKVYEEEEFEQAEIGFAAAQEAYLILGEPLTAAEMANNRSVALLKSGKPQAAFEAAKDTDKLFDQAGDQHRRAIALGNQAAALDALKRKQEALELYQQSAEIFKQLGDMEMRAYVLQSISGIQLSQGKRIESLVSMEAALEHKPRLSLREKFLRWLLRIVSKLLNRPTG
jgi:tetratricopeptide (TPR) repeat protein